MSPPRGLSYTLKVASLGDEIALRSTSTSASAAVLGLLRANEDNIYSGGYPQGRFERGNTGAIIFSFPKREYASSKLSW